MGIRIRFGAALLCATALAACGGGGGSDGDTAPTDGLPAPGDIVGADPVYIDRLENYVAILGTPLFDRSNLAAPPPGSATFTGVGRITDASVNSDDVTAASLRNRSVVTTATATINLANPTQLTATQTNFIDVDGRPVAGRVDWTGTYTAQTGVFRATVEGNVGGTEFATPDGQASVIYLERGGDDGVSGLFVNGNVTASGWLRGSEVTGDFVATR